MKKKTIVAIIPARKGSKGIAKKNIKKINNKPLIQWTIETAKEIKLIDEIIISTDDKNVEKISKKLDVKVPFLRPKKYAKDNSLGIDTVIHALKKISNFDYVLLLQPTSPMRSQKDIKGIINFTLKNKLKSSVSVNEVKDHPELMYTLNDRKKIMKEFPQYNTVKLRQKYKKIYRVNGALYMCEIKWLLNKKDFLTKETYGYIMPLERSIDIDDQYDWKIAEMLLKNNN